jgi:heme/copper-type cytochrome/quinol oxidase subunit 3
MTDSTARRVDIRPRISKDKLGFWFFIGSEVILFGTLILSYIVFRAAHGSEYAGFRSHLSIPLIGANTFVLVLSSYFVVRALKAAQLGRPDASVLNLLVVLALGSLFIAGQAYEWSKLFAEGIRQDNVFGSPFFIVTGIHGTHVLIGLAWAGAVLLLGLRGGYDNDRHARPVEYFGLYWHFVDIVWIILFSLIYLI